MKRFLVLLSLATAFALVACKNQDTRESGQQGTQNQPGSEPGSDVRTAFPNEESGATGGTDKSGSPYEPGATGSPGSGSVGSPGYPSDSPRNQPGSTGSGSTGSNPTGSDSREYDNE